LDNDGAAGAGDEVDRGVPLPDHGIVPTQPVMPVRSGKALRTGGTATGKGPRRIDAALLQHVADACAVPKALATGALAAAA
jgi:hypothetical protein